MKASELKRGLVLDIEGRHIFVKDLQVQTAASRSGNTLYKIRGYDLISRQKFERAFKGDESLRSVEFERRPLQFLFRDQDGCTFMEQQSFEQHQLSYAALDEDLLYLTEGMDGIYALIANEQLLGIELPATVDLKIIDCAPAMKAASASARNKPATLSTGLVAQVPEYLTPGEVIKINTQSGEFISRA